MLVNTAGVPKLVDALMFTRKSGYPDEPRRCT